MDDFIFQSLLLRDIEQNGQDGGFPLIVDSLKVAFHHPDIAVLVEDEAFISVGNGFSGNSVQGVLTASLSLPFRDRLPHARPEHLLLATESEKRHARLVHQAKAIILVDIDDGKRGFKDGAIEGFGLPQGPRPTLNKLLQFLGMGLYLPLHLQLSRDIRKRDPDALNLPVGPPYGRGENLRVNNPPGPMHHVGLVTLCLLHPMHPCPTDLFNLFFLFLPCKEKSILPNNLLGFVSQDLTRPLIDIVDLPRLRVKGEGPDEEIIQQILILLVEHVQPGLRSLQGNHQKYGRDHHDANHTKSDIANLPQPELSFRNNLTERNNVNHAPRVPISHGEFCPTYKIGIPHRFLSPSVCYPRIKIGGWAHLPDQSFQRGGKLLLMCIRVQEVVFPIHDSPQPHLHIGRRGEEMPPDGIETQDGHEGSKIDLIPKNGGNNHQHIRFT